MLTKTNKPHFNTGRTPWNKGKKGVQIVSDETRAKLSKVRLGNQNAKGAVRPKGSEHYLWKGDNVSYSGIHNWVRKHLGNCKECSNCLFTSDNTHQFHWANISHEYKRELSDWVRLCVKCHKAYDMGRIEV